MCGEGEGGGLGCGWVGESEAEVGEVAYDGVEAGDGVCAVAEEGKVTWSRMFSEGTGKWRRKGATGRTGGRVVGEDKQPLIPGNGEVRESDRRRTFSVYGGQPESRTPDVKFQHLVQCLLYLQLVSRRTTFSRPPKPRAVDSRHFATRPPTRF